MGLDNKKKKKIGSMLTLSAMAPGTIIGTGVNTVSANYVSADNDTLENFLNRNHLGWIYSAIHWLLVKLGCNADFYIGKEATMSIACKLLNHYYKIENSTYKENDIKKDEKRISEISKNFEDLLYFDRNESYETSWTSENKKVFREKLSIIEGLYGNYSKDEIEHLKKLCKLVELGDKTADYEIEYENSYKGKELIGFGWALTKTKLYFRIEACIDLIRKKLDSCEVKDHNKLINSLNDSLPGQFNNQEFDEFYYGQTENSLIGLIRMLATDVKEKDYSIYKNKNIIDDKTLNLIGKAENEINRNNNNEVLNNGKIVEPLYHNFSDNVNDQDNELPSLKEISSNRDKGLFYDNNIIDINAIN